MGMTMTQKILAKHAGLDTVEVGQLIEAKVDMVLGNDITTPVAITEFEKAGFTRVFDRDKISIVLDHYTPCKDIKSAELCLQARNFAHKHQITNFFDVGQMGVEHALLPEKGLCAPGEIIVGADSHTCTYGALGAFSTGIGSTDMAAAMATGLLWFKVPAAIKVVLKGKLQPMVSGKDVILHLIGRIGVDGALYQSLEFTGEGVSSLSMDDRFTISNMAIEAGGKNGIFPVDEKTMEYINGRVDRPCEAFQADPDAVYASEVVIDLNALEPTVAMPHLPHQRPAGRRRRVPGQTGGRRGALHRHPRHPGHCAPGHEGGSDPDLHPGGLRRLHPHLRTLPGRTHGRDGGGGAHRLHHQPQLCGPHGPCDQRGHSGLSRCGRRLRCGRLRGRSPRLKRCTFQTQ